MEEGPEPQEWVERAAEEHHHAHAEAHAEPHAAGGMKTEAQASAITAAVLAVLAALGSLLSGHAANQAILAQSKATNQWAYFQAKSTKGHLYEVAGELGQMIVQASPMTFSINGVKPFAVQLKHWSTEAAKETTEKEEIKKEAVHLETESRHELQEHNRFAVAVSLFQVGIVLASVSILVKYRPLYALSLVLGAGGIVGLLMGLMA